MSNQDALKISIRFLKGCIIDGLKDENDDLIELYELEEVLISLDSFLPR